MKQKEAIEAQRLQVLKEGPVTDYGAIETERFERLLTPLGLKIHKVTLQIAYGCDRFQQMDIACTAPLLISCHSSRKKKIFHTRI